MSQTSKTALRSLEKAEFLAASTRTQNPLVSLELANVYGGPPAGDPPVIGPTPTDPPVVGPPIGGDAPVVDSTAVSAWEELQENNALLLERSSLHLRQADRNHQINKTHLRQLQAQRRALVKAHQSRHRDLRRSFQGTYGPEALELVGLDEPPANVYLEVREHSEVILERMQNPDLLVQLPLPRSGQSPLDLEQLTAAMEAEVQELEQVTAELQEMRKIVDGSKVARDEALDQHRRDYVNVARVQEGYYRLTGFDDLADRIRAARRRSPSPEEPDEPEGTSVSPDGGEVSDGPAPAS